MSFNIMDLVKDQLSEQVMGYLGKAIGGSPTQNTSAISSAIPAILGSLMKSGSTESGAGALLDAVAGQDESILDNLGGLLGGKEESSMMKTGSSILGSLLGGGSKGGLGDIIGAVTGFSGASKSGTTSLMGLLTPIILSVIKKQLLGSKGGGLSVGGLMNMLNGQKDNVTAAIPQGFLKTASGFTENVTETAENVAQEGKSLISKLLPIILLIGAAWLAYNFFFNNADKTQTKDPSATVQIKDLSQNVTTTMASLMAALGNINDAASAKAAIPAITSATNNLSKYAGLLDKLPAGVKGQISKLIMDALPMLDDAINKIAAIPGVGPIIKPAIEKLSSTLGLFK